MYWYQAIKKPTNCCFLIIQSVCVCVLHANVFDAREQSYICSGLLRRKVRRRHLNRALDSICECTILYYNIILIFNRGMKWICKYRWTIRFLICRYIFKHRVINATVTKTSVLYRGYIIITACGRLFTAPVLMYASSFII